MKIVQVHFWLRSMCQKTAKIYIHISVDGERTKSPFSTGIKIEKHQWNKDLGRLYDANLNKELDNIEAEIKMQATILRTKGVNFNAESLKNALFTEQKLYSFSEVLEKYLTYKFDNEILKENTVRTILDRKRNLVNFLTAYDYKNISCEDFKPKIIDELQTYLRKNLNSCCDKHLRRHFQLVNATLNYAVLYEFSEKKPFAILSTQTENTEKKPIYLSPAEQLLMEQATFIDPKLEIVRDVFVFSYTLGLACIDRINFDYDLHTFDKENGVRFFSMQRQKSSMTAALPFPQKAANILNKYGGKLPKIAENKNIKVENQLTNRYLKIIAEILGIKKNITTHTARKTACSNWLRAGINENIIAAMMGWSTTKELKTYAEVEENSILQEVQGKI